MDAMNPQTQLLLTVVVIALIAVGGYLLYRRTQSDRLKTRFGPEYGRAVQELGSQDKAEAELRAREVRVQKLRIVPLRPEDAKHFVGAWNDVQRRFVDDPKIAVAQADELVRELLMKRGYPMADFEHRADDISVDHPQVVNNYRAAHAIAERDRNGSSNTEELRQAVVHYRALFAELLDAGHAVTATQSSHLERAQP